MSSTKKTKSLEQVSLEIKELLESNEMAIQSYLVYSEFGITSNARLISTKENEQETNKGEAGESKEPVEPIESSQS